MRRLLTCVGLTSFLFLSALSAPASAATIIFDVCDMASLCNQLTLTTALNGNSIDVTVSAPAGYGLFGDSGANRAFGINVAGTSVAFSNISPGFTFGGLNGQVNGYGFYEAFFDGPHNGSNAFLPFSFTVTRSGGFASDIDLFETNAAGYLAAAHLRNNQTGVAGFVAADDFNSTTAVPEPGSLLLMATGLLAAWRGRKAQG